MIRYIALFLLLWPVLASAQNEEIVADLSQRRVSITTNFTGSEILIFGAVKRSTAIVASDPLDVIITVAGPDESFVVRKMDRIAGIWVNAAQQEIDSAPSFYSVMSTAPLEDILSDTEDLRYRISKERVIRAVDGGAGAAAPEFTEALIRIRESEDIYQLNEGEVSFFDGTLFRAQVALPANLTEGDYETTIYLVRNKSVVARHKTTIAVSKVGLERFLYNLAHNQPLIYGIMSLFIAIAAGWLASAAFRLLRN
ncbi:MAG: TIGR02186 family protein [Pseudomonadota bacterium]